MRLRRILLLGGIVVVLSSVVTLAIASQRIVAEESAFSAPSAGLRSGDLNSSALLPGTTVAVSPLPGSYDAPAQTQISMLGAPAAALSESARQRLAQTGSHGGHLRGYSQGDGASFVPSSPFIAGERRQRPRPRAQQRRRARVRLQLRRRPPRRAPVSAAAASTTATPTRCSTSTRARNCSRRSLDRQRDAPPRALPATSSPRPTPVPERPDR